MVHKSINIRIWSKIPVSQYLQIACYRLVYTQMCEKCFCEHFLQDLSPMSIKCVGLTLLALSLLYIFVDYYGIYFNIVIIMCVVIMKLKA